MKKRRLTAEEAKIFEERRQRRFFAKHIIYSSFGSDYKMDEAQEYFMKHSIVKALDKLEWAGEDVKDFIAKTVYCLNYEGRYKTLMNHYLVKDLTPNEVSFLMCCDDFIQGLMTARPETYPIFKDNKAIFTQTKVNPIRKYQFALDVAEACEKDAFYTPDVFAKYINYVNHGKNYDGDIMFIIHERKTIKVLNKLNDFGVNVDRLIKDTLSGKEVSSRFEEVMFQLKKGVLSVSELKFIMPYNDFINGLTEKYPTLKSKIEDYSPISEREHGNIDKLFKTAVELENEEHLKISYSKGFTYSANPVVENTLTHACSGEDPLGMDD